MVLYITSRFLPHFKKLTRWKSSKGSMLVHTSINLAWNYHQSKKIVVYTAVMYWAGRCIIQSGLLEEHLQPLRSNFHKKVCKWININIIKINKKVVLSYFTCLTLSIAAFWSAVSVLAALTATGSPFHMPRYTFPKPPTPTIFKWIISGKVVVYAYNASNFMWEQQVLQHINMVVVFPSLKLPSWAQSLGHAVHTRICTKTIDIGKTSHQH